MRKIIPSIMTNTNFLKLWLAQVSSQIGLNALYYILTLKIYAVSHSNTAVSVLILTFTLPNVFFGYLAGVYVDQVSLKKVMIFTNLFRGLMIFGLIFVIGNVPLLFLIVFLLALATVFFIPAEGSAIPALIEHNQLITANSIFSLTLQTSLIIGFLFGGFLIKIFNEKSALFIVFSLFIASLVFNMFLPKSIRAVKEAREGGMVKSFIQGIVFLVKHKVVRDSILFLTLTTTIIFILAAIGPGYVDSVLRLDVKYSSALIVAPATIGIAVGSIFLSNFGKHFKENHIVNTGLFGVGVTFLILAFIGSTNLKFGFRLSSLFFIFLLGVENALITIPITTDFQKNTPEEFRGRAYGLLGTFISGISALPVLLSGAIGDLFGIPTVLGVLGIIVLFFGLYRLKSMRSIITST